MHVLRGLKIRDSYAVVMGSLNKQEYSRTRPLISFADYSDSSDKIQEQGHNGDNGFCSRFRSSNLDAYQG
jgi:hypothetical protein